MATDGYFGNVGRHDINAVMAPFSEDAVMTAVAQAIHYDGKNAIKAHFTEFLATYPRINVHILHAMADEVTQAAAIHFEIEMENTAGAVQRMRNANHFHFNANGQIAQVHIFMTGTPGDGFTAGNSA